MSQRVRLFCWQARETIIDCFGEDTARAHAGQSSTEPRDAKLLSGSNWPDKIDERADDELRNAARRATASKKFTDPVEY